VQPLDEQKKDNGQSFIAVDHSSLAGKGDLGAGGCARQRVRQVLNDKTAPIRSLVVGVVDEVSVAAEAPKRR